MKENIIKAKSFLFAIKIVALYKNLIGGKEGWHLAGQLLKSGTSVGAMVREAEHAETTRDFIHKLSIAQKEINETIYWLDLLYETEYIDSTNYKKLKNDAIEIIKIITAILKTMDTKVVA